MEQEGGKDNERDKELASLEQIVGILLLSVTVTLVVLATFGVLEHPLTPQKLNMLMIAAISLIISERAAKFRLRGK